MRLFALLALVLMLSSLSFAALSSYVQDNAGVLTSEEQTTLDAELRVFESKANGAQFVVFTENKVPEGMSLEERSLQIAEENGIGQKEEDNGILFYLATEDRQFRWEVGYGMEPVLNAALLGRISRSEMIPSFQAGNYAEGIKKGVTAVEGIVLGSVDPAAYEEPQPTSRANVLIIVLVFFVILSVISALSRKSGKGSFEDSAYIGAATGLLFGRMGRGGFGGGGFGGFSGGGGGFGGGGFSGRF
ncbi:MAG: TPM domain-containing protein [Nanoarchaeota archaeon]|nr:TPM domain-containing protein [Nanoarchaeota archaeon]